jgi:hypothetical protein
MRTPVPKCLQKKKMFGGIFIHLIFFAMTGKPHPSRWSVPRMYNDLDDYQPPMLAIRTRTIVSSAFVKSMRSYKVKA